MVLTNRNFATFKNNQDSATVDIYIIPITGS